LFYSFLKKKLYFKFITCLKKISAVPQYRRLLSRELAGVAARLVHRALTSGEALQLVGGITARVTALLVGRGKAFLPIFHQCDTHHQISMAVPSHL
jgi:hypothetical protein